MKEHSIFFEAGFVAKDAAFAPQADMFKSQFAEVLQEAVMLANGEMKSRMREYRKSGSVRGAGREASIYSTFPEYVDKNAFNSNKWEMIYSNDAATRFRV